MSSRRALAGLLAVLLCAAGCAQASVAPASAPVPSSAASGAPAPIVVGEEQSRPRRVSVVARQIDGPLIVEGLGLDARGGHAEPPVEDPGLGSWYNLGPRPGERGPAVILGHVNGAGKPGLFANLHNVRSGDQIVVDREDGSQVAFEVYKSETIEKTEFPKNAVYGNTDGAEIRLVTCGGDLDRVHHRYLSNIIVFGRLIPL